MITRKSQDNSFPLDVPCNCAHFFCKPAGLKLKSDIKYLYVVKVLAGARAWAQLLKWVSFSKAFRNQPKRSLRSEGVQNSRACAGKWLTGRSYMCMLRFDDPVQENGSNIHAWKDKYWYKNACMWKFRFQIPRACAWKFHFRCGGPHPIIRFLVNPS